MLVRSLKRSAAAVDTGRKNMFQNMLERKNQVMLDSAYNFLCDKLGIDQEERKKINVDFVRRLGDADGDCCGHYNLFTKQLTSIDIRVKSYGSTFGMIDALAHELVHAKQHLNGEFKFEYREVPFLFFFKRKMLVRTHKGQICDRTPYFDKLCEQEAYNLSHELLLDFCSTLKDAQCIPKTESIDT